MPSSWHDFGAILPGPGVLARVRRYPEDTPSYWGTFDIPTATLGTQLPDGTVVVTPWSYLTHWTPLVGAIPQWPTRPSAPKAWRDPFFSPPADGAHVWLRRFDTDCALLRADYHSDGNYFALPETPGWRLEWYQVWKWKPA